MACCTSCRYVQHLIGCRAGHQAFGRRPNAFSELVTRYTRAIYNVTYRFTNDAQEAENLTQETFLRAWNALPRISLDKPLKPYLAKIAVNLCHDWAEQKKIANVLPLEADGECDFPDEAGDPLHAVSDEELRERVRAKMELLPPLYPDCYYAALYRGNA